MKESSLHTGGDVSYVSIGEAVDGEAGSFFLRLTDTNLNWHYSFNNLPIKCDLALQRRIIASRPLEDASGRAIRSSTWPSGRRGGRIRAVTLGQDGSWIIWGSDWYEWSDNLPVELRAALAEGEKNKLTINVSKRLSLLIKLHAGIYSKLTVGDNSKLC
jgi:hypothetical protein